MSTFLYQLPADDGSGDNCHDENFNDVRGGVDDDGEDQDEEENALTQPIPPPLFNSQKATHI